MARKMFGRGPLMLVKKTEDILGKAKVQHDTRFTELQFEHLRNCHANNRTKNG